MYTVLADDLLRFASTALQAHDVPAEAAEIVAAELVTANLRGHDSHGIIHLPKYLDRIASGQLQAQTAPTLKKRQGAVAVIDVGWGFGFVAARQAAALAAELAHEQGLGSVALQRCSHVGRLGSYPEQIAQQGLLGFAISSGTGPGGPVVAPHGGQTRLLGTNPLAVAIPVPDRDPLLIDFATAAIAGGKIALAQQQGEPLPQGALLDTDGHPSTRPEDYFAGGAQLPFGGHKGYALSLCIEILANLLTAFPPASSQHWERAGNPTMIGALNPESFVAREWFEQMVFELCQNIENAPADAEHMSVRLPGERSFSCERERRHTGIPLNPATWEGLVTLAQRLNITLPPRKETR